MAAVSPYSVRFTSPVLLVDVRASVHINPTIRDHRRILTTIERCVTDDHHLLLPSQKIEASKPDPDNRVCAMQHRNEECLSGRVFPIPFPGPRMTALTGVAGGSASPPSSGQAVRGPENGA
jgi:hypothetical protein